MKYKLKAEFFGLLWDLWKMARKSMASSTLWVGIAGTAAIHLCNAYHCDPEVAKGIMLTMGGYAVKELGGKFAAKAPPAPTPPAS